jgi:hypothetical protein
MESENAASRFTLALTRASLGKIPPELRVATAHDDHVMIFLLRVGDANATTETLMGVITLAEADSIVKTLNATRGLIRIRFPIDEAYRLKDQLETAGTTVEFIRPDDVENDGD